MRIDTDFASCFYYTGIVVRSVSDVTHLYGDDAWKRLACVGSSFNGDTQRVGALWDPHQSRHGLQQAGLLAREREIRE